MGDSRRLAFLVLAVWLVLAPVLLGSVPEADVGTGSAFARLISAGGGYAVFRVCGYLALGLLLPGLVLLRRSPVAPGSSDRTFFPLAALLLLGLVQILPFPLALHRFLSPGHAADLAVLLPGRIWVPTSVDPGLTREAVVRLFVLLIAALAVLHAARGTRRGWWILGVIAGTATAVSAYGLLETSVLADRVLGFLKPGDEGGVTGTFFYRGNFVAFAAAGAGIAAAGLVTAFSARRPPLVALAAAAIPVLVAGVYLSRSRAGLVATAAALAAGFALPLRRRTFRFVAGAVVLALVVGVGLLFGSIRERFAYFGESASASFLDVRVPAWRSTLELFSGRPVLGTGLGTYRRAIHLTQSPDNPNELWFAHSDPLNLLAEGGVAGVLFGAAIALLGLLGALKLARGGGGAAAGAGAACSAGLVGMLAMAAVDFPLQIPATALVFVTLVFLPEAVAAPPPEAPSRGGRRTLARLAALSATGLLLLSVAEDYGRGLDHPGTVTEGEALLADGRAELESRDVESAERDLRAAKDAMPFDGRVRYYLALLELGAGRAEAGKAELAAAHHVARGSGELLFRIGRLALAEGTELDLALASFREAGALEPRWFSLAMQTLPPGLRAGAVPERGWAFASLGDRYRSEGDLEKAVGAWWRAVDLGQRGAILDRLREACRTLGREEECRRELRRRGFAPE